MRNKSTIIQFILTLIVVNCYFFLCAQQPITRNFKINDGLPSNEAHAILSDSKGYIWVATDAGICKYDGFNFTTFSLSEGLPESTVLKLYEDRKGRIWFTTLSSFVGYILDNEIFVSKYQFKNKISVDKKENFAYSLYVDENDTLWVGTLHSAVLFKLAPPYTAMPTKKEYGRDFIIEFSDAGDFIFGTYHLPRDGHAREYRLSFEQKWIKHKIEIKYANFKIESRKDIVFLSAGHYIIRGSFQLAELQNDNLILKQKFDDVITQVSLDKKNNVWIGFSISGIYKLGLTDFLKDKKLNLEECDDFFKSAYITDMANDFEGGYWFTTLTNGIVYMPSADFRTINTGGSITEIMCVYPWLNNQILVNEPFGDLVMLDKYKEVKRFDLNLYSFYPSLQDKHIHLFSPLITVESHPQLIEMKGNTYQYRNQLGFEKRRNYEFYLKQFYTRGKKLYGAVNYEVFAYNTKKDLFQLLLSSSNRFNDFLVDENDIVWLATVKGLTSYDQHNKKWKYWGKTYNDLAVRMENIVEDANGNLWISTRGKGLIFFDKKNKITIWNKYKGLPSNIIRKLYIDDQNILWIASNLGLSNIKIDKRDKVNNFTYLNSFNIGNINHILKQGDKLLLATSLGLYQFSIKQLQSNLFRTQKPLYINRVENALKKRVLSGSEIDYNNNFLKFSFVAISYAHATNNGYSYMINGIDRQWRTTNNTYVEYPNLPSGNYTFLVKIAGVNPKGKVLMQRFNFIVSEPYWQSAWFIGCCILFSLFVVSGLIRWRILVIQRNERLEAQVKIDLASMEAKALRAQMNPHFIFNSLGSIQYYILQHETELADFYLGKFSKLIRQILESSKNELISLTHEIDLLENYIQLDNMRHNNSLTHEINYSSDIDKANIWIPNMIIQPFVENSILHGLAPLTERKGHLTVSFRDQGTIIECIVEDNGIGREAAEIIKKNKIKYHQSISTSLNAERLRLYNKMYNTKAEIRYEDLYDEQKNPIGTRVILLIPVIKRL